MYMNESFSLLEYFKTQIIICHLKIENNFIFYHDNDPQHTAINVHLRCLYNCLQVLKIPPQSRDLNSIKQIWSELRIREQKHKIKTKSE